jgi:hypothetical protein
MLREGSCLLSSEQTLSHQERRDDVVQGAAFAECGAFFCDARGLIFQPFIPLIDDYSVQTDVSIDHD